MEGGAKTIILKTVSIDEYNSIEQGLREKIEAVLNEHIDDYLTAKALFESTRGTQQDKIKEAQEKLKTVTQERDDLKIKADAFYSQFEETNKRLVTANAQINKIRDELQRYQKEVEEVRKERDLAVDERQITSNTLERREVEVERLSGEVHTLTGQLRSAIQAKCEAIAAADEARANQMEIDFKEKRFEAEVSLLRKQVSDLTSDLSKMTEEMSKQRRDLTSQLFALQTKVAQKEDELRVSNELNIKLKNNNRELEERIDDLSNRLKEKMTEEERLIENFQQEVKAQTKLAQVYKERLEDCESRAGELSGAVRELQKLLGEASSQYGELEGKLNNKELEYKTTLEGKSETIAALKEELSHANILLQAVKQESCEEAVSRLSPMAASASKLIKSGLTLTQLYTKFAEVSQELLLERQKNNKLDSYVQRILKDIEEKAPILEKQRDDYNYAISSLESLTSKVDDLENEMTELRMTKKEAQSSAENYARENRRLNGCCSDLGRQVCYLLREVEAARGNDIPLHGGLDNLAADAKTSSQVISKHLVTFRNIEELQMNNEKLLAVVRELSTAREEEETGKESVRVNSLLADIRRAEGKIAELESRENILQKEIGVIKSQRDVYAKLYKQHAKPGPKGENLEVGEGDLNGANVNNKSATSQSNLSFQTTPKKEKENEGEMRTIRAMVEDLKKEHTRYREERRENERLMTETIEKLRTELSESIGAKTELSSRAEHYQEIAKTLQGRVQKLTEENAAMEKRCNTYLASISKHEMNIHQLRNQAMDAMNRSTLAEQQAQNLRQEVQMLKDQERRLLREREAERKVKHGQELLMSNLEALKAKFECSEAESKMRLESRLEEAHLECSALRRRLQEEQDRLGRRVELAEEQAKTAKERLEEAKSSRERLMKELTEAREEMKEREARLESMSSELTNAISKSQPILERENRIKELEAGVSEKEADIGGLKEQLEAAKRSISDLSEVSQSIERQLAEVTQEYEQFKKEAEEKIAILQKSEAELKGTVSQLEMKLKTASAAEAEMRAEREAEVSSLRARCETLTKSVEEARERAGRAEANAAAAEAGARLEAERAATETTRASLLIHDLESVRGQLSDMRGALEEVKCEKERAVESIGLERDSTREQLEELHSRLEEADQRIGELSTVNDTLHQQIQELGIKVSIIHNSGSGSSSPPPTSKLDMSDSLTSDSLRESDKVLEVMRHLRKEKMAALSQADALRGDKLRLEADIEILRRQLDETKRLLEEERNLSETPNLTAERHAQLLAKVQTMNELTENNRGLLEERDRLIERLRCAEEEVGRLERDVVEPARREASEKGAEAERWTTEAAALRAESQRWQERANQLIERTNKNPDELKRLTQEKENLSRQLGLEKDQARSVKTKLEVQLNETRLEKEAIKTSLEKCIEDVKKDLTSAKEDMSKAVSEVATLREEMRIQEETLNDIRNKERQIRLIAKRYKQQYTDVQKTIEDERKAREEAAPLISQETEEKIKELTDQVTTNTSEIETLRRENESLKMSYNERDDRAKQILKNARAKILHLTEDKKKLEDLLTKVGEGDLGHVIAQFEKDRDEEVAEKERLQRELEVMSQRLAIMQRQLDKQQQGPKPSTSSAEKGTVEPPTANIKPMTGPSTTGVKQPQGQHAVTVTPWRETPFASIRPMSPQTRTVVVLPTSQTSSSTNQPVLVAPQQQVHTSSACEALSSSPSSSSHTDYMPATSSAVHNIHQATVILGQHMEVEAGSEEVAPQHSLQPAQNTVSIALVLPQPAVAQPQGEVGNGENTGVVSGSSQEQVSEQSVSASSHSQPPILPTYYRQVEDSGQPVGSSGTERGSSSSSSGSSNQQAASSTTSTRQGGGSKRTAPEEPSKQAGGPPKRGRLSVQQGVGPLVQEANVGEMLLRSDGLEVEYQVPTSSQRDQEDDILVISDEEDDLPDDGGIEDGQEFEEEVEEEGRYLEGYGRDAQEMGSYEEGEGPDIDEGSTTDQDTNEVDLIDDSSEVPNRCESTRSSVAEPVATGGEATSSLGSVSSNQPYPRRPTAVPILNRHHILLNFEDGGDDSIVPSTPTLFVPRRGDGFGEAVSSPQVPSGRFTFAQDTSPTPLRPSVVAGVAQVASEGMDDTRMDLTTLEEGTGRSVPSTPSHVSPQDVVGEEIGQSSGQESVPGSGTEPGEHEADRQPTAEDNPDGVSSEGEKAGGSRMAQEEEEGREAEASPSRRGGPSAAAGLRRAAGAAGSGSSRGATRTARRVTPIVWQPSEVPLMSVRGAQRNRGQQMRSGYRGSRGPRRARPPFHPGNNPFQQNRF